MAVSREQFGEWKAHPVTQQFKDELREAVETLVGEMVMRREPDLHKDAFTRAFVRAADSILTWAPEFTAEGEKQ